MIAEFENQVAQTLEEIKAQGLFKTERVITSPQDAHIAITGGKARAQHVCEQLSWARDHPR
jgi:glycine C-acetyltransferase